MVAISQVRSSNAQLRNLPPHLSSPTAVFAGATQGIGLATLRQLVIHTVAPTCYIIGRRETRVQDIIAELKELNENGRYICLVAEVSLLEDVDRVCEKIRAGIESEAQGKGLDMLLMSQGYLLGKRNETKEGIDTLLSLRYYSRLRFVHNLLPLLNQSPSPHVVSILAGGKEAAMYEDDLPLVHNYGIISCANHGTTMNSLAFEHLAKENPKVAFLHNFPGYVDTGIQTGTMYWPFSLITQYILKPLLRYLIEIPLDECGDRQLFHATSSRYPSLSQSHSTSSSATLVPLPPSVTVASSIDGTPGGGCYLPDEKSESAKSGTGRLMMGYRKKGMPEKVWKHTVEMFESVKK